MSTVNRAIIIGRVGQDPEIKRTESGVAVANLSLATDSSYKKKDGEKVSKTEWHRIVAWDKLAEIIEKYVEKGKLLYIDGRIETRKWEDKDGNTRYTTEIRAFEMKMLGSKADSDGSATKREEPGDIVAQKEKTNETNDEVPPKKKPSKAKVIKDGPPPADDDDLPF